MKRKILIIYSMMLFFCGIYCNEIYSYNEETNDVKIEKYTQEIEKKPNKADAYISRAEVYNNDGKYDLALKDVETALKLDISKKDKEKALDQKIKANINKKFNEKDENITKDKIFKDINELTMLNPQNPKIYHRKGWYYYNENQYNISIYFFNKTISLIKNDNKLLGYTIYGRAWGYYGLYSNINKNKIFYDKAIEDVSFIINNLANDVDSEILQDSYFFRGLYYNLDSKTKEAAFNDYSNAIKIGKNEERLIQCYYFIGRIYFYDKKYKETIENINKFHELLNKNNQENLDNKNTFRKSIFESKEYMESLYFLAESYYQTQNYNDTIKTINLCIGKTDYPVRELFIRGDSFFNVGEYDLALKDFEAILKFNIDNETKKVIPEKIKQIKQKKKEKQLKKIKTEVFSDENIEF